LLYLREHERIRKAFEVDLTEGKIYPKGIQVM